MPLLTVEAVDCRARLEHDGLLEVLADLAPVASQDAFDQAIELLDHAFCLWRHWRCKSILDADVSTQMV